MRRMAGASVSTVMCRWQVMLAAVAIALLAPATVSAAATSRPHASSLHLRRAATARTSAPRHVNAFGELDCNGDSTVQRPRHPTMACTDIRGAAGVDNVNTWGGRFYDNGHYIGHDEPDMTFLSNRQGSGNDVTWTERIPYDPSAPPTVAAPGADVVHQFELTAAPWFSMAMCDPNSYPQTPCTPESDRNAPAANGSGGGGSAFMEMQMYPPGWAPYDDAISCDNQHWCAALTIDSLECTENFAQCNAACEEPANFAWIQTDGVPTGPAEPAKSTLATFTPNGDTLMMNPGDVITVHMFDAPVPGHPGARAFEVMITDLTTHQTGWMQASASNGFGTTSMRNCSGTPFNFQPEYNTAARPNIIPWAALQTNISTEFEIGHFTPCTSLWRRDFLPITSTFSDLYYNRCKGPYEVGHDSRSSPEPTDAFCYPLGDTHGILNTAPDTVTGCADFLAGGDLDFDGTSYWPDWPVGPDPTQTVPGSFVQSLPTTGSGQQYDRFFIQTDTALSESTCTASGAGCTIPPDGPGHFYPYWSRTTTPSGCFLEFGNVSSGVNDYGQDAQYGTDQQPTFGYPEFEGPVMSNSCSGSAGSGAGASAVLSSLG